VVFFVSRIEHPTILLVQAERVLGLLVSLGFTLHLNKLTNHNLIHLNLGQSTLVSLWFILKLHCMHFIFTSIFKVLL
jgi:hypothetical protein